MIRNHVIGYSNAVTLLICHKDSPFTPFPAVLCQSCNRLSSITWLLGCTSSKSVASCPPLDTAESCPCLSPSDGWNSVKVRPHWHASWLASTAPLAGPGPFVTPEYPHTYIDYTSFIKLSVRRIAMLLADFLGAFKEGYSSHFSCTLLSTDQVSNCHE